MTVGYELHNKVCEININLTSMLVFTFPKSTWPDLEPGQCFVEYNVSLQPCLDGA